MSYVAPPIQMNAFTPGATTMRESAYQRQVNDNQSQNNLINAVGGKASKKRRFKSKKSKKGKRRRSLRTLFMTRKKSLKKRRKLKNMIGCYQGKIRGGGGTIVVPSNSPSYNETVGDKMGVSAITQKLLQTSADNHANSVYDTNARN